MNIRVSNTNSNSRQRDAVRVYLNDKLIGEVFPPKHNPLQYLRDHPTSRYREDLAKQVNRYGVSINQVLNV